MLKLNSSKFVNTRTTETQIVLDRTSIVILNTGSHFIYTSFSLLLSTSLNLRIFLSQFHSHNNYSLSYLNYTTILRAGVQNDNQSVA